MTARRWQGVNVNRHPAYRAAVLPKRIDHCGPRPATRPAEESIYKTRDVRDAV